MKISKQLATKLSIGSNITLSEKLIIFKTLDDAGLINKPLHEKVVKFYEILKDCDVYWAGDRIDDFILEDSHLYLKDVENNELYITGFCETTKSLLYVECESEIESEDDWNVMDNNEFRIQKDLEL